MQDSFLDLIVSERVSEPTRQVMLGRLDKPMAHAGSWSLSEAAYATLALVVQRMVPQEFDKSIDIAALLVEAKSQHRGNGWRYASLPADEVSLADGLRLLDESCKGRHGLPFLSVGVEEQMELLKDAQAGKLDWAGLDSSLNSSLWFEELLSDAVEVYVSQPATLALMCFDGFAFLPRWNRIGLDTAEPWEPHAE